MGVCVCMCVYAYACIGTCVCGLQACLCVATKRVCSGVDGQCPGLLPVVRAPIRSMVVRPRACSSGAHVFPSSRNRSYVPIHLRACMACYMFGLHVQVLLCVDVDACECAYVSVCLRV